MINNNKVYLSKFKIFTFIKIPFLKNFNYVKRIWQNKSKLKFQNLNL